MNSTYNEINEVITLARKNQVEDLKKLFPEASSFCMNDTEVTSAEFIERLCDLNLSYSVIDYLEVADESETIARAKFYLRLYAKDTGNIGDMNKYHVELVWDITREEYCFAEVTIKQVA